MAKRRRTSANPDLERREFLGRVTLGAGGAATATLLGAAAPRLAQAQNQSQGQNQGPAPRSPSAIAPPAVETPRPMADVRGKVAFITGGSSGIGLGIARVLSKAGMKVVFTYLTDRHRDEALASFPPGNAGVHAIKLDVTDREAFVAAADEAERVFGKIHVLVNNAGVGIRAPIFRATYNDWDWGIGVNLNGVFNGIHTILPRIIRHGEGGHVVTVSSMSGMFAGSTTGVYTTSKFAVVGMMEALRTEMFAEGLPIGVSVYVPGGVNSNIRDTERNRPPELRNPGSQQQQQQLTPEQRARLAELASRPGPGMDPLEAGEYVLRGIQNNDLYIISHPEYASGIEERHEAIMASVPEAPPAPPERVAYERVVLTNVIYPTERDRKRAQKRGLIS
ncbi:MAG: SDR family NAD(P)-dependent oxidoreductase [Pseudomonadota bacterium]|jgi:Short-chain alcohol dehydrogenase of unknown specificity